ncbi:uncharacterized protein [Ptychodera flava]|uniref:uncharacterized protein n=1 Tax=Ptychodera flava TaxID=63121 RepID=UPI00396AB111
MDLIEDEIETRAETDFSFVDDNIQRENNNTKNGDEDKTEAILRAVSSALDLTVAVIEITDDFFEIGGNSARSIAAIANLQRIGYTLSLHEFYRAECLQDIVNVASKTTFPSKVFVDGPQENDKAALERGGFVEGYEIVPLNEAVSDEIQMAMSTCQEAISCGEFLGDCVEIDPGHKLQIIYEFVDKLFLQESCTKFSFLVKNEQEKEIVGVSINIDFYNDDIPRFKDLDTIPTFESIIEAYRDLESDARAAFGVGAPGDWLFQVVSVAKFDKDEKMKATILRMIEMEKLSMARKCRFHGVVGLYSNSFSQWLAAEIGMEVVLRSKIFRDQYYKYISQSDQSDWKVYLMAKTIQERGHTNVDLIRCLQTTVSEVMALPLEQVSIQNPVFAFPDTTDDHIVQVVRQLRKQGLDVSIADFTDVDRSLESIADSCKIIQPSLVTLATGMRACTQSDSGGQLPEDVLTNYDVVLYSDVSETDMSEALDICVEHLLENDPMVRCLELDIDVKRTFAAAAVREILHNNTCQSASLFLRDKQTGHLTAAILCADLFYQCHASYEGLANMPWKSYVNTLVTMEMYFKNVLGVTSPGKWACQVLSAVRSTDFKARTEMRKFIISESIRIARNNGYLHILCFHSNLTCQEISAEAGMDIIGTSCRVRNMKYKEERHFDRICPQDARIVVMAKDFLD